MSVAELVRQEPRICCFPEYVSSAGPEAVELAAMAGLILDPWQALVLEHSLGERPDGKWAAFEVGVVVPRQNGKGSLLEARVLAGLFLLSERLIIWSAHQFDTSLEAFRRLLFLIEETPELERRVKRVSRSHGEEGIELRSGQRIRFRTRTKGGGRGFTSDCLILDEAMILPESSHGALLPTLSARPNPQVFYTGSAVDRFVHEDGTVLARVRERALRGDDPALAYFEWSLPGENPSGVEDPGNEELWADANPGLGIRILPEHIEHERLSMDARTFAVERLGVGDWPDLTGEGGVISPALWAQLGAAGTKRDCPVRFAFDVSPDRSSASIAAAGTRADGLFHVEVVDHRRGTGWVVDRLRELVGRHANVGVFCDASGPAASLIHDLEPETPVTTVNAREHGQACGMIFDAVDQRRLRHLGTGELTTAIHGAVKRPLGDAWAWSRKNSGTDITSLVACTIALWGAATVTVAEPWSTAW